MDRTHKVGECFHNTKTKGFGKIIETDHSSNLRYYLIADFKDNTKSAWIKESILNTFIDSGILIKYIGPKKWIHKHNFNQQIRYEINLTN